MAEEKKSSGGSTAKSRGKSIVNRARRIYATYTAGLKPGDFKRLFTEETRGIYRHFGESIQEKTKERGLKALLRGVGRIFQGFLLAMAPPRRILYGIALSIFIIAGVVIITAPEGAAIREDISVLSIYSFIIVSFLLALELADKLSAKDEIEIARDVQLSLLPSPDFKIRGFDLSSFSAPAREVGGDYYDFVELEGRVCIVIGDVSGHGLAAGLVMAMAKSAFQAQLLNDPGPEAVLSTLNKIVTDAGDSRTLMTFLYCAVNPETGRMQYANAGHVYPLYYSANQGRMQWLESGTLPLGVRSRQSFERFEQTLEPGDLIVLTSDGAVETINENGDSFGYTRFRESVERRVELKPGEILDGIMEELQDFAAPGPRHDDTTLIVARFKGGCTQ